MVGRSLGEIPLPKGVTIAAIVRDLETPEIIGYQGPVGIQAYGHVVIAHRDTVIQSGDHVIVFCVNKKLVHKVEKLFQVGFGFL